MATQGSINDAGSTTFTLGLNSLLIVPAGFDPETEFGEFIDHGFHVHNPGSTLTIGAAETIIGRGTITDQVDIQGSLHATTGQGIDLESCLQVSGNGSVDLGTGGLHVDNDFSRINDAGELSASYECVGYYGTGTFIQNGGSNTIGDGLYAGKSAQYSPPTIIISPTITVPGSNPISEEYCEGSSSGSSGTYELNGGKLAAGNEYVGNTGTGAFVQNGGGHVAGHSLYVSYKAGSNGTYELHGGEMSAWREYVGASGTGTLVQHGGSNAIGDILHVGYNVDSSGTYELHDGHLSANRQYVGYGGSGTFIQHGGTNTISNVLHIGRFSCSSGTYELHGGTLSAGTINVGRTGTLGIHNAEAVTTIHTKLHFGEGGTFTAVPGSTIHMTGSAFENESADSDALAGLANLTLIFEGGSGNVDLFEVAGEDVGAVRKGFCGNFAMDALQLGGEEGVGQVQLVDLFDNQPDWEGSEALYVENLLLGSGSYLDLNGLNLYFHGFIDLSGTIELGSGNLLQVSMPGDANRDDVVNDADASILAAHWQQSGMYWKDGDFNNDGIVNDEDASILAAHWQQTWKGEAAVPEPSAILLCIPLCLAGILLGRRRHRRPA